jgi:hypothetical protein
VQALRFFRAFSAALATVVTSGRSGTISISDRHAWMAGIGLRSPSIPRVLRAAQRSNADDSFNANRITQSNLIGANDVSDAISNSNALKICLKPLENDRLNSRLANIRQSISASITRVTLNPTVFQPLYRSERRATFPIHSAAQFGARGCERYPGRGRCIPRTAVRAAGFPSAGSTGSGRDRSAG